MAKFGKPLYRNKGENGCHLSHFRNEDIGVWQGGEFGGGCTSER